MSEKVIKKEKKSSLAKRSLNKFLDNKLAIFGMLVVVIMTLMSIFAPLITKVDPNAINMNMINQPPSSEYIFGTDSTGRDLFARLLYGGRISILIGVVSALTTSIIGTVIGLVSG